MTPAERQAAYRKRHPERVKAARFRGKENDRAWRAANREKLNAAKRSWYEKDKDKVSAIRKATYDPVKNKARSAADYQKRKVAVLAKNKAWREANPEKCREFHKRKIKANPDKYARYFSAASAARRAVSKLATPSWANQFFIREIYDLAKIRTRNRSGGVSWQVDHIVPLQSDVVCGLHVEHNLAVIPKLHNMSKGNRYWPDMPEGA